MTRKSIAILLAGLLASLFIISIVNPAQTVLEVYNPAGVQVDGIFVDKILKKTIKGPGKLPKNKLLVIYCDCTHEEDSADLAVQLNYPRLQGEGF